MVYWPKVGTCEGVSLGVSVCCVCAARCWRRRWRGSLLARFTLSRGFCSACCSAGAATTSVAFSCTTFSAFTSTSAFATAACWGLVSVAVCAGGVNATISLCAWSTLTTWAVVIISWRGASINSTLTWGSWTTAGAASVACSFSTLGSRWRFGRSGRGWLRRSRRGIAFCCSFWTSVFCCCSPCWRRDERLFSRGSWRCCSLRSGRSWRCCSLRSERCSWRSWRCGSLRSGRCS